jgi:hypothetical protein
VYCLHIQGQKLKKNKQQISTNSHGLTSQMIVLWRIDPLLGKGLETNKETTAVAMQRHGKHTSTTIKLLLETVLCNPLIGSCDSSTTTMETGAFSMWSVPRRYLEGN